MIASTDILETLVSRFPAVAAEPGLYVCLQNSKIWLPIKLAFVNKLKLSLVAHRECLLQQQDKASSYHVRVKSSATGAF